MTVYTSARAYACMRPCRALQTAKGESRVDGVRRARRVVAPYFILLLLSSEIVIGFFHFGFPSVTPQVPVQRVTKYPLLLARLYKVTPEHHLEARQTLNEARHKIQLHLEHINSVSAFYANAIIFVLLVNFSPHNHYCTFEIPVCPQLAKDISSTKLWRKIYAINGKRPDNEDLADIKFRKVILHSPHCRDAVCRCLY